MAIDVFSQNIASPHGATNRERDPEPFRCGGGWMKEPSNQAEKALRTDAGTPAELLL
jgi:hypothetical protein